MEVTQIRPRENSTNVRIVPAFAAAGGSTAALRLDSLGAPDRRFPTWLRTSFRIAGFALPQVAAAVAEHFFLSPPRREAKPAAILESGHRFYLNKGGQRIAIWSWGDGPTVLLQHGWGGRSEVMAPFVEPLLRAGFSVIAPDAPAHGESSGRRSNVLEFAAAIEAVADRVRPIHSFVGHSVGAAAGALAISRGLKVERAVFVAPISSLRGYLGRFAHVAEIAPRVLSLVQRRIEGRLGVPFSELEVPRVARAAKVPLLVFHDPADREIPWHDAAAITQAWPGARLVDVAGVGHNRILRDPGVVARTAAFLSATA
jgi:pimeloyl-ACP methyl ester carboxylesterase